MVVGYQEGHVGAEALLETCANHVEVAASLPGYDGSGVPTVVWQGLYHGLESHEGATTVGRWSELRGEWWQQLQATHLKPQGSGYSLGKAALATIGKLCRCLTRLEAARGRINNQTPLASEPPSDTTNTRTLDTTAAARQGTKRRRGGAAVR